MEIATEWETTTLNGQYPLKFGTSFRDSPHYFHTIRYDFKPASVEKSAQSFVEFSENNEVTVTIPKVNENGQVDDATLYKGSKRLHQKEFLLLFDHDTQTFTLEKLTYNVQIKKTRGQVDSETLESIRNVWKEANGAEMAEDEKRTRTEIASLSNNETDYMSPSSLSDNQLDAEECHSLAETLEAVLNEECSNETAADMPDIFGSEQPTKDYPPDRPSFDQLQEDLQLSDSSSDD